MSKLKIKGTIFPDKKYTDINKWWNYLNEQVSLLKTNNNGKRTTK